MMPIYLRVTYLSLIIIAILGMSSSAAIGQETHLAKTARLLNESGINYAKVNDTTWTVTFDGKSLKEIPVAVTTGDGIFIAFTLIKDAKGIKLPAPALLKLLQLNEDLDRVKVGIGKDGQISVRIDVSLRTLDKDDLAVLVNQVAAAADEVHIAIKGHLPKAK